MTSVSERLDDVFERIDDAFFALDEEWRFTFLNDSAEELLEVSRQNAVGEVIWEEFEEAVDTRFQREYERAMETQEPVSFEEYYPPLETWFEVNAYPSETGLSVYFRDVTDRVERDRERERYESIVETAQDGIYVVDDDGRFTMVNESYAEMTGYDREQLLGADVSMVVDEQTSAAASTLEAELAEGSSSTASLEATIRRADGRTLEAEATFALLPDGDRVGVVRDVTERKERERELEQFRALTRAARDVIVTIDASSTIQTVNPAVEEVFGYDADELVGDRLTRLMPEEYRDRHLEGLREYLETGTRHLDWEYVELPGVAVDGEELVLGVSFNEVEHDGERYFTGIVRDVTERKERERQLELYERIIETVEDGVYAVDDGGRFIMVNDALCEMTGYDRERLLGEHVSIIHGEWITPRAEELAEDVASGAREEATLELELRTDDGDRIPAETRVKPFRLDGETGRCGVIRDVSEREERERELRRARERAQALFENSPDLIDVLDLDGRYLEVNQGLCEALGYEEEERHVWEFDTTVDEEDVRSMFAEMELGDSRRFEGEYERRDGSTFPIEINLTRIRVADRPRILAVVRDITERKERERELRQRIRQQEVVTELGQYALETQDVDTLMDEAAWLVSETLDTDYCKVLDFDREADELLLRQGVGWDESVVGSATVSAVDRDSQAAHTLEASEPITVEDLETETRFSGPDLLTGHDVRSGISTIIGPSEDPWGVLGTHDTDRREFTDRDVNFVQSVANILAAAIGRHRSERLLRQQHERLSALNDINSIVHGLSESMFGLSSRSDIEQLVCDRLARSDSYEFAWIGTVEDGEVVVEEEAGVENYLENLTLAVDAPPGERGPTARAHRTGEIQIVQSVDEDPRYEPWREHARRHGYRASAAIPIVDGEELYGTLNLYSSRSNAFDDEERDALRRLGSIIAYAISSVERDRTLQRERNRLEFINRLLRHNLLNSLNVVKARLEMLDGRVDFEVADHLDTAADRTREMIDFVETVRQVTKVIGRGDEQELGPVDIGDVLATRVELARESYPEAEFHLEPPPSVDVVADDLLGEALDNVLVNAVQHNTSEEPTVWVESTVEDDRVVVSIADDGPGIPDERKSTVFDRSERGFEDPGTGFGLYLVKEILDSYGGHVTVEDNTPQGARLRLTFQRA